MKKRALLLATVLSTLPMVASAVDLVTVFKQALISDALFQEAISQRLATRENVPISVAQILPQANFVGIPSLTRTTVTGSRLQFNPSTGQPVGPGASTTRAYSLTLSLSQTIFNFAQFATIGEAFAQAKGADATLNSALQDLMIRVAKAYFAILQDEDNVSFTEASKVAFAQQLDQIKQQYNVGLKTITDVYTAQASYDSAVAQYIAAQTQLSIDRENLRVITGVYYSHLSVLSEKFPLITPQPAEEDAWVRKSAMQNWDIKAAQHAVDAARSVVQQQFAGHFPTITAEGTLDKLYSNTIGNNQNVLSTNLRNGPGTQVDRTIAVNVTVPLFEGGGVIASTNQASFNLEVTQQKLEQISRNVLNLARQSYLSIIAGKSQVAADSQAVKSTISSLEGLKESYRVGTETLVNVLNQQQKVVQAQVQYATDRYAFVNNILLLKRAAGTLSFDDLGAINLWLKDQPIRHSEQYQLPNTNTPLDINNNTVSLKKPRNHLAEKKADTHKTA